MLFNNSSNKIRIIGFLVSEVKIINALPCRETYSLRISKFVETLSAQLVKPAGDEVFKVWVHGEDFSETYA